MSDLSWLTSKPFAHRGLHDEKAGVIENTVSAFRAAIDAGYGIETDLQATADNQAVVFHDSKLDRLTTSTGLVTDHTAAKLVEMELKSTEDRMITLPAFLEYVDSRVPLLIEIKSSWNNDTQIIGYAIEHVRRYSGPAALMSFDPRIVQEVREAAPDIVRGIVAEDFKSEYWNELPEKTRTSLRELSHWEETAPNFVAYGIHSLPAAPAIAARYLMLGPLLTWTVRDENQLAKARQYADNIIFENLSP